MNAVSCTVPPGLGDPSVADQATAIAALRKAAAELSRAVDKADSAMDGLRELIVELRPTGLMTVDQMAEALSTEDHPVNRNYIDSVWSKYGETHEGKQTRAVAPEGFDRFDVTRSVSSLKAAGRLQRRTADQCRTLRAERDRLVSMVYASKILGPTAIARESGIDRNHVLRLARKAGFGPVHREGTRNQHTAKQQ